MRTKPKSEALALLKESNCLSVPVRLEQVAKHLGIKIIYEDFQDEMSGVLVIKNGKPAIGVNRAHHPNRQRFTIAHEIGHFVLHHKHSNNDVHMDKKWAYFRSSTPSSVEVYEVEANQFAAELLMPESLIRQSIEAKGFDLSNDLDTSRLAQELKVSEQALTIRLVKLGLIEPY